MVAFPFRNRSGNTTPPSAGQEPSKDSAPTPPNQSEPGNIRRSLTDLKLPQFLSTIFSRKSSVESNFQDDLKSSTNVSRTSSMSSTAPSEDERFYEPHTAKLITHVHSILRVRSDDYCVSEGVLPVVDNTSRLDDTERNPKVGTTYMSSKVYTLRSRKLKNTSFNVAFAKGTTGGVESAESTIPTPTSSPRKGFLSLNNKLQQPSSTVTPWINRSSIARWSRSHTNERISFSTPARFSDVSKEMRQALVEVIPRSFDENGLLIMNSLLLERMLEATHSESANSVHYLNLLKMVDRELPFHIFCHDCRCLHLPLTPQGYLGKNVDQIKSHLPLHPEHYYIKTRPRCFSDFIIGRSNKIPPILPHIFTFSQLQLAVKRHKIGMESPHILGPLNSHRIFQRPNWKHLWSSETKIIDDRLIVRTQHWYFLNPRVKNPHPVLYNILHTTRGHSREQFRVLCQHKSDLNPFALQFFAQKVNPRLGTRGKLFQISEQSSLIECRHCSTIGRIDMGLVPTGADSQQYIMVVTAWRDLGRCENCFDPCYTAHFSEFNRGKPIVCRNEPKSESVYYQDGLEEAGTLENMVERYEVDEPEKWRQNWMTNLSDIGLWHEMIRHEIFGRGERLWHELDDTERQKRKDKMKQIPRL